MAGRALVLAAATAAGLLSACEPTQIGPGAQSRETKAQTRLREADEARRAANPVKLPPSIRSSSQYRCADNSVLLVDWMSDGLTARVSTDRSGPQTALTASAEGAAKMAEGWSLKGASGDAKVTVSTPAHPKAMGCHV